MGDQRRRGGRGRSGRGGRIPKKGDQPGGFANEEAFVSFPVSVTGPIRVVGAIDEAAAGKRTLVHATFKNLELLVEGDTVVGAISQASERKIVTFQPWVEMRDGKRFLHIPEGAGGLPQFVSRIAACGGGSAGRTVVPFAPSGPAR